MKKRGECYITQFFYLNLQTLIFIGKMKQLKFLMVALTLLMGIFEFEDFRFSNGNHLRKEHRT